MSYQITCPHTYSQGFTFLCMHDYGDCLGLGQCRYPESLKELGLSCASTKEVVTVEEKLPVSDGLHSNPAFRVENKRHQGHILYPIWSNCCNSCYNVRSKNYLSVGKRGIRVAKDWHLFLNFSKDFPDFDKRTDKFIRLDSKLDYSPVNYVILRNGEYIYGKSCG